MPGRQFNFPLATLIKQAGRLKDALADATIGTPVLARLPATFQADFSALLTKVSEAPAKKSGQAGDTGQLTQDQNDALSEMVRLVAAARRSASLAFPGDKVRLREEFKVGVHDPQDLGSEIQRATVVQASSVKYATELGEHGWTAADATQLDSAINALSGIDLQQEASKAEGPGITAATNADANKLYKNCLSIQNAARLQFPSTQPGNETPRARYLIGEFPPQSGSSGDTTPPPPPPPTP